jgi:predicted nuclease of predicted toxin-antitoxin system
MSLRFFSDQCVPTEITESLKRQGYAVALLREVLPVNSPDPVVIAKALELRAVLVSLNGDFADIIAYPPSNYSGIIAIQLNNHPETIPYLMAGLLRFLSDHPDQLFYRGKLLLVEPHRIRIRE